MFSRITRKIQEKLGLTRSETAILLFLSFGLILGGGVKLFHLDSATGSYDFTESDSFFAEASSKIDSILASEEDTLAYPSRVAKSGKEITSPIDINVATVAELTTLPGVGKVTAQRIVDYRTAHGKFGSIGELLKVKGIGAKKFERLKQHVKAD